MARNYWTDEELILTLDLYFKLPFGRLNKSTPEVKQLANLIGRTDNSVALRLVNYAACDPYIRETGRTGMTSGVGKCMPFWNYFSNNKEELFLRAEEIKAKLIQKPIEQLLSLSPNDFIGKERETVIRQRVNQNSFRSMILANYNEKCAITGISLPQLLIASHIIPWADNVNERLNPENGICLSPLYDKAFDKVLIGIRTDYTFIISKELKEYHNEEFYTLNFANVENKLISLPEEHAPNKTFLEYHLEHIFKIHN